MPLQRPGGKAINAESVIGARFLLESYLDGDEALAGLLKNDMMDIDG
jgi:hypothetical protein